MKKTIVSLAFIAMSLNIAPVVGANDAGFDLSPSACKEVVSDFMDTRLTDSRSARVQLDSDPYKVMVDMRSADDIPAWAVDILVKSRLPSGSWSNYQPYTVIFQDGKAVALESEVVGVTRT